MEMLSDSVCVNCGKEVNTNFCSYCGQKHPPRKINLLNLYQDFQSRIYGFDGMFPRTLKDLTIKPGKVAQEFVIGNRVKYVGPVGYYFLMLTFYLLFIDLLNIDFSLMMETNNPFQMGKGGNKGMRMIYSSLYEYMRFLSLLSIPISAFIYRLIFRKSGWNIWENAAFICYISGHIQLLLLLALFLYKLTGVNAYYFINLGVGTCYTIFASVGFYEGYKKWIIGVRSVLAIVLLMISIMIIQIVVMLIIFKMNPELKEQFKTALLLYSTPLRSIT